MKYIKNIFFVLLLVFAFTNNTISQTRFVLEDTINVRIILNSFYPWHGIFPSKMYMIDYDNDNDLDLFVYGLGKFELYDNLNNNTFSLKTNFSYSCRNIFFGDMDLDGDMDFIAKISVYQSSYHYFFKNTLPDSVGFDTLLFQTSYYPRMFGYGNIFNKKGGQIFSYANPYPNVNYYFFDIDSLYNVSPMDSLSYAYPLYQNSHINDYVSHNADMNNDGYIDFINSWWVFLNNGINADTAFSHIVRPLTSYNVMGDLHHFDIDNDGYIDEIANSSHQNTFYHKYNYTNKLFKNDHSGNLIHQYNGYLSIDTIGFCKQIILDYNNDGYLDILTTKADSTNVIYANLGNFNFFEDPIITNLGTRFFEGISADYDNDGDMDIIMLQLHQDTFFNMGYQYNQYFYLSFYRNDSTPPNTPPTAPQTMWTTMDSTKVIFHWLPATDVETPQATLSYNLMVGTSPKGIDITSPLADTVTGFRRVVELGNAQLNNFYILDKSIFNLGDTVYWSVQTIDNGFGYSPFSQESRAVVCERMEAPVFDTICSNDSLLWHGNYYSSAGYFRQSYGSAGLDSVFFLDLTVYPAWLDEQTIDLCAGQSYSWHGQTYFNSGTYNVYHTTTKGCDSVERLILKVHPTLTQIQTADLCQGDSLTFGGGYLKSSGIYYDSLLSIYGCDSIMQMSLSVSPEDTSVVQHGDSLMALSATAIIRWWDCDAQSYIPYAYGPIFIPWQNGRYAAEISENGCFFLSRCFEVKGMGIGSVENHGLQIKLMPNPNKGEFFLELIAQGKQHYQISIYDALGKEIFKKEIDFENYKKLKFDLKDFGSGIYQLQVISDIGVVSRRVILQ